MIDLKDTSRKINVRCRYAHNFPKKMKLTIKIPPVFCPIPRLKV